MTVCSHISQFNFMLPGSADQGQVTVITGMWFILTPAGDRTPCHTTLGVSRKCQRCFLLSESECLFAIVAIATMKCLCFVSATKRQMIFTDCAMSTAVWLSECNYLCDCLWIMNKQSTRLQSVCLIIIQIPKLCLSRRSNLRNCIQSGASEVTQRSFPLCILIFAFIYSFSHIKYDIY